MRKILIGIIVLLLVVLGIMAITKGINIGSIEVTSVSKMSEKNKKIDKKIEEINTLIDTDFPKKISELNTAGKKMDEAREEYLKYSTISTNDEIIKAMQGKVFKIEFLWTRLGQHVRNEQVVLDFKIVDSSIGESKANDLEFAVTGTYTRIINFVYAIENDPDLNFRIENFQLIPDGSDVLLIANFTVRNVVIEGNTSELEVNAININKSATQNTTNTNSKVENTNTNETNTANTNVSNTNTTNSNSVDTNTTNSNSISTNTTNTTSSNSTNTTDTNN